MKIITDRAFSLTDDDKSYDCPGAIRHDVLAIDADVVVSAVALNGGGKALLGTVTAGNCGSFDFACASINVAIAGTGSGELRSLDSTEGN